MLQGYSNIGARPPVSPYAMRVLGLADAVRAANTAQIMTTLFRVCSPASPKRDTGYATTKPHRPVQAASSAAGADEGTLPTVLWMIPASAAAIRMAPS